MISTVISYPIPAYSNVPIHAEFYKPRRFDIANITLGQTTIVTTTVDQDYVVGQLVRLIIPSIFGSYQLNETQGYVLSVLSTNSVEIGINSVFADAFIPTPYTATITNITQASQAVITANNTFHAGQNIIIGNVSGMTEINNVAGTIISASPTSLTVSINSVDYSAYSSGGTASLFQVEQTPAQILAIGDINSGVTNTSGRTNNITYIPGSFINISPN